MTMPETCTHCGAAVAASADAFCPECRGDLSAPPRAPARPAAPATAGPGSGVWYATDARVFGVFKFCWYDDRGDIDVVRGGPLFVGRKQTFRLDRLAAVELVGPVIPWMTLVGLPISTALIVLLSYVGFFKAFTLDNPVTYVLLVLMNLFALSTCPLRWVKVVYDDPDGPPRVAYFTVGSNVARWTGGTRRLFVWLSGLATEAHP